jgi:hypothetical protein
VLESGISRLIDPDQMDLTTLTEQQLRQELEDLGIVTAGLLTRPELLRRYRAYLDLYEGGARVIRPARIRHIDIGNYPATDMRY